MQLPRAWRSQSAMLSFHHLRPPKEYAPYAREAKAEDRQMTFEA